MMNNKENCMSCGIHRKDMLEIPWGRFIKNNDGKYEDFIQCKPCKEKEIEYQQNTKMKGTLHASPEGYGWLVKYTIGDNEFKQDREMPVYFESHELAYKLDWIAKSYGKQNAEVEFEVHIPEKPKDKAWHESKRAKLIEKSMNKTNEIKQYPEIDKIYQHYKGGKYVVITMAKHSETGEELVIYKSLHFGSYHARPLSLWFDRITLSADNESFKSTSRFVLCS